MLLKVPDYAYKHSLNIFKSGKDKCDTNVQRHLPPQMVDLFGSTSLKFLFCLLNHTISFVPKLCTYNGMLIGWF